MPVISGLLMTEKYIPSYVTSKTHKFVKVWKFPNKDSMDDNRYLVKQQDMIDKHLRFIRKFYEYTTKKSYNDVYVRFLAFHDESMKEEIYELSSGIMICECGKWDVYCIPLNEKTNDIVSFIIENCENETKILKRTRGTYMDRGISTHWRNLSKELVEKSKDKEWYKTLLATKDDE